MVNGLFAKENPAHECRLAQVEIEKGGQKGRPE